MSRSSEFHGSTGQSPRDAAAEEFAQTGSEESRAKFRAAYEAERPAVTAEKDLEDPTAREGFEKDQKERDLADIGSDAPMGRRAVFAQQVASQPAQGTAISRIVQARRDAGQTAVDAGEAAGPAMGLGNAVEAAPGQSYAGAVREERKRVNDQASNRVPIGITVNPSQNGSILNLAKTAGGETRTGKQQARAARNDRQRMGKQAKITFVEHTAVNHEDEEIRNAAGEALKTGSTSHPRLISMITDHISALKRHSAVSDLAANHPDESVRKAAEDALKSGDTDHPTVIDAMNQTNTNNGPTPTSLSLKGGNTPKLQETVAAAADTRRIRKEANSARGTARIQSNLSAWHDLLKNRQIENAVAEGKGDEMAASLETRDRNATATAEIQKHIDASSTPESRTIKPEDVRFGGTKELETASRHFGVPVHHVQSFIHTHLKGISQGDALKGIFDLYDSRVRQVGNAAHPFDVLKDKVRAHSNELMERGRADLAHKKATETWEKQRILNPDLPAPVHPYEGKPLTAGALEPSSEPVKFTEVKKGREYSPVPAAPRRRKGGGYYTPGEDKAE